MNKILRELEENIQIYNDLLKGKYTDANVSLIVMQSALNKTHKKILKLIEKQFKIKYEYYKSNKNLHNSIKLK